jgi:Ribulose-5-phosphate 4-epimerase and related epimerases and aldolases
MDDESAARSDLVAVGKRLYEKDMVAANDGNISVRLDAGLFLITPTGVCKGDMTEDSLLVVDECGAVVRGRGGATSEIRMHLAAYKARADVRAVVHAHPPAATAYAICGGDFSKVTMAEMILVVGNVGVSAYGTPSTDHLTRSIQPHLAECDAILLENHGAMTMGKNLWDAYYRMESLEHYCKTNIYATILGGARCLSVPEIDALKRIRAGASVRS